jgi:hypothetical protein
MCQCTSARSCIHDLLALLHKIYHGTLAAEEKRATRPGAGSIGCQIFRRLLPPRARNRYVSTRATVTVMVGSEHRAIPPLVLMIVRFPHQYHASHNGTILHFEEEALECDWNSAVGGDSPQLPRQRGCLLGADPGYRGQRAQKSGRARTCPDFSNI